jgi:large subunit ribosomal protein L15
VGKTSGRGGKGQTARSGVALNGFEGGQTPLYRRMPKRGFRNTAFQLDFAEINLSDLQKAVASGRLAATGTITQTALVESGVLRRVLDGVRLLGNGAAEFSTSVTIEVVGASKSAIAAVEKAGGKVVLTRGASDKAAPTRLASLSLYGITDHNDQWREAEITWNNAPKNDTESPGGVQPKGTVLLAKAQLPGLAAGEPVEFESEELTRYLNWKAGALPDAYGTGAAKDSVATFIVVASDQSPTVRFHSHLHKSKDPEQTTRFRPRVILRRPSPS